MFEINAFDDFSQTVYAHHNLLNDCYKKFTGSRIKITSKILFRVYNFIIKSITRSLIIFKKPRKMTKDFFNHYIFVRTFQWTLSECLTNVTITVKFAMVTYILGENG